MGGSTLIRDFLEYLKSVDEPIFAESNDYNYFRSLYKKKEVAPPPLPEPKPIPVYIPPPPPKPIAAPPPPPPPKVAEPIKPKSFTSDWKDLFTKIAPEVAIITDLPSDAIAKKIATRWKTKNQVAPITVLFYQEIPEQKMLLEQIAKAIDIYFGPARLVAAESIEKEKQWEAFLSSPDLKSLVICDYSLWQLSHLLKSYKENGYSRTRQLGEKPLFLLPDLSLYLKDPQLKRSLWKALCAFLQPSSSTKA